jgi:PIN domain nuclease of toxin-antitoxin system
VILLDTNAVIWLDQNHVRARPLLRQGTPLAISPASMLEWQLIVESGRLKLRSSRRDVLADPRWHVDDPSGLSWFSAAAEESWTRDPFDRLIVAHARLRGWRLATSDREILDHLRPSERVEL